MESVSIWQVLEEAGLPRTTCAASGATVAVADPCITRHQPETRERVRRIARTLGVTIDELLLSGDKPECCGYGGLMFNANPKLARDVIYHRTSGKRPLRRSPSRNRADGIGPGGRRGPTPPTTAPR
jgi:Fe-S oxidoreductase